MTKAELIFMDDLDFTIIILENKLKECPNKYTPLATKLRSAIETIKRIRSGGKA